MEIRYKKKQSKDIIIITIGEEGIETTAPHLFYTENGWEMAESIKVGCKIKNAENVYEVVRDINARHVEAGEIGSYMPRVPQNGGIQSQIDLALKPEWGNTTEYVTMEFLDELLKAKFLCPAIMKLESTSKNDNGKIVLNCT